MLKSGLRPSDIITKASIQNALTMVMALGGSTNAVLHYLAIARAVGVDLTLDDFQRISDQTPLIADLKPSGKFVMEDLHGVSGLVCSSRALCPDLHLHSCSRRFACTSCHTKGPLLWKGVGLLLSAVLGSVAQTLIPGRCAAQIGGTPAVLKYLMEKGLIDGSCMTVTGVSHALVDSPAACSYQQTKLGTLLRPICSLATDALPRLSNCDV